MASKRKAKALILGVGLDGKDGHVRMTHGDNFQIVGGSEDTHGDLQEKAIKFNEHLVKRKKRLEDINKDEFAEIADKIGMLNNRKSDGPSPSEK